MRLRKYAKRSASKSNRLTTWFASSDTAQWNDGAKQLGGQSKPLRHRRCLRRRHVCPHVLVEQEALRLEGFRGAGDQPHIGGVIGVTLLERWARVAGREAGRLGLGK